MRPTPKQLATLVRIRDEAPIAMFERNDWKWSARSGLRVKALPRVIAPVRDGKPVGERFHFATVSKCDERGWVQMVDGIISLTDAGRALLDEQAVAP